MKFLEGKSPAEQKKILAAALLGLVAVVALYLAFGPSFGGSKVNVKVTATPRPSVTPRNTDDRPIPTVDEQDFVYQTTPIDYQPGAFGAPDPGRNIFDFYEPPPPCPTCPTPVKPTPTPIPATPAPTPALLLSSVSPQAMYAGSPGFRMEVNGDRFTPDSHIYFNQNQLPTTFISPQKLATDIPANFITQEGPRQIIVQTPDGKMYSDQYMWTVQAPPRPTVQYIGMIGRKRYNNDTAYFTEQGKPTPFGARLNDVVNGRFRLINIAPGEVTFEDTALGFKHHVPVAKGAGPAGGGGPVFGQPARGNGRGGERDNVYTPAYDPSANIPGVPQNVPRYVPPQPQEQKKKDPAAADDIDDEDDGGPE